MSNTHAITQDNKKRKAPTINSLSLYKLQPFSKHPFKQHNSEKMQELAKSITENGVIVPILVRPIENEKYEIVSGHNRVEASRLAGLKIIPCDVREMDDATATITMVDSNLQRETVLPSEKAWAYRYKLEAMKSQGKRNDLTSHHFGEKSERRLSVQKVSEESSDSMNQVLRYIRLTNLIPEFLDKVDERKLSFIPAVELSYLTKKQQKWLYDILSREEKYSLPIKQALKLKGISKNGELTYEKIDKIIIEKNHEPPKAIKVSYNAVKEFFPLDATPKEYEKVIRKALEEYFKSHSLQLGEKSEGIER